MVSTLLNVEVETTDFETTETTEVEDDSVSNVIATDDVLPGIGEADTQALSEAEEFAETLAEKTNQALDVTV